MMRQGMEEIIQFDKRPEEKTRVYTYENAVKRCWSVKVDIQSEGSSKNGFVLVQAAGWKPKYLRRICPQHFRARTGASGRRFGPFCSCFLLTVVDLMELLHPAIASFLLLLQVWCFPETFELIWCVLRPLTLCPFLPIMSP